MILGRKGVNRCTGRTGSRLTTGLVEGREGLPQKLFDALTLGGLHRCHQHRIGERLGVGLGCGDPGLEFGEPRSEEHTSELQSLMRISYAVFCLKKKKTTH